MAMKSKAMLLQLVNEIVFSESDDSDSDFEDEHFHYIAVQIANAERRDLAKVENFYEDVIPRYFPDIFRNYFRMTRETFQSLVESLACSTFFVQNNTGGKPMVEISKQVAIFLWYSSTLEILPRIADRFGVCGATVLTVVRRVSNAVKEQLTKKQICWPVGGKIDEVVAGFEAMKGVKGVIGAIDGSHIPIKAPKMHANSYINRKMFKSIILQAVCDDQMKFTDVFVGWPGSVHDSRVLKYSDLFARCSSNDMLCDVMFPKGHFC